MLIPGVRLDDKLRRATELIAQRIVRYTERVGAENVIAGTDCGFAALATSTAVYPSVAWAKLTAMSENARLTPLIYGEVPAPSFEQCAGRSCTQRRPLRRRGGEPVMGLDDKIKNKAEEVTGQAKETAGKATDDRDLEDEGRADQAEGNLKQAGEKIKDVFKD